jgi:hypothetical protein
MARMELFVMFQPMDSPLSLRLPPSTTKLSQNFRLAGPFLSAFQAYTSFLERSRGYALRAHPWLPSAAPAAL